MTPDLVKLRDALAELRPIVERLELELVDDPTWAEPSDASYLSAAEREDPDIAANVDAMAETNKLISWFGYDAEGYVGLWRGPANRSLADSPVVRLDGDGQYSIVAATIADYLAIAMPEDQFASTRETLTRAGFKVGFNPDAIWGALDGIDDDPNLFRSERYEENRVKRGLARSGDDTAATTEIPMVAGEVWALDAPPQAIDDHEDHEGWAQPEEATRPDHPAAKPAAQPAAQPAAKPAAQPAANPAVQPAAKPAAQPAANPAVQPAAKPAAQPAAKPAAQPAAKPAAKPAARPAKHVARQTAAAKSRVKKVANRPATKSAAKKAAAKQPAKKPAAKKTVKKPAAKARKKR